MWPVGIGVNTWYEGNASVIVATVHSIYEQYNNGSRVLSTVSTEYVKNATSFYGSYPVNFSPNTTIGAGIPATLLPTEGNLYASSFVSDYTAVTFPRQNLTITSPTPFWYYPIASYQEGWSSQGKCWTTSHDGTLLWSTYVNGTYIKSSYQYTATQTVTMDPNPGQAPNNLNLSYAYPFEGNVTAFLDSAVYEGIGQIDFDGADMPGIPQLFTNDPWIVAQYPSIGLCTAGLGLGNPSVHIPVNQLTEQSTTVITKAGSPPTTPAEQTTKNPAPTTEPPTTSPEPESPTPEPTSKPPVASSFQAKTSEPVLVPPTTNHGGSIVVAKTSQTVLVPTSDELETPKQTYPDTTKQPPTAEPVSTGPDTEQPAGTQQPETQQPGTQQPAAPTTGQGQGTAPPQSQPQTSVGGLVSAIGQVGQTTQRAASPQPEPTTARSIGDIIASVLGATTTPAPSGGSEAPAGTSQGAPVSPAESPDNTQAQASQYVVGSQTLSPGGPAVTQQGSTYSLAPQGTAVVINGKTSAIAQPSAVPEGSAPVITIGGSTVVANSQSEYEVGSQTLVPGGSEIVQAGTTYSLAPAATAIVVNGETSQLAAAPGNQQATSAPAITVGNTVVTANSASQYIVGSQTLAPGSAVTVQGSTYSLAPSGSAIVINGQTSRIAPAAQLTGAAPVLTVGSATVSALGPSQYVVGSQTISAGGEAVTVSGTTYSVAPSGSAIVVNGQTTPIAAPPGEQTGLAPSITVAGSTITANSASEYVIGSQTLAPGSSIVVSGSTYSLAPSGTALVVDSGNGASTLTIAAASAAGESTLNVASSTGIVVVDGQTLTYSHTDSAVVIGSRTLSPGSSVTVSGELLSLASGGSSIVVVDATTTASGPGSGQTGSSRTGGGAVITDNTAVSPAGSTATNTVSSGAAANVMASWSWAVGRCCVGFAMVWMLM